jgi:hypothetical protein
MNGTPAAAVWCSLETGVDGLPSRLLFVGLAAGAGSAERGKNGGRPRGPEEEGRCWEQGSERAAGSILASWGCSGGKMGADVQDVGMALGSGQGRGLEAAVKGKKNNGQPEGLCCWLEKMGEGWRLGEDEMGLGLLFPFSDVVKIAPPLLKIQYSMVFIGKMVLGFQTSPSTFPFLLFSFFFL